MEPLDSRLTRRFRKAVDIWLARIASETKDATAADAKRIAIMALENGDAVSFMANVSPFETAALVAELLFAVRLTMLEEQACA